tara:strand:- start:15860 stop:16288 length:429 start_codon:yes stop_codon:yes gene_type:complete
VKLPSHSKIYKAQTRSSDERGSIVSIVDEVSSNVSIITCNKGSIRSNHYHLTDWHFMYVLDGKIDYFCKDIETGLVTYYEVNKQDNIFTPPKEIHATYFPIDTKLIVTSKNPRDKETYENDTVRVEFLNQLNIHSFIEKYRK